jgi:hypothetical protein
MDIKDIQNLIRFVAKAGVSEVKYKTKILKSTSKLQALLQKVLLTSLNSQFSNKQLLRLLHL